MREVALDGSGSFYRMSRLVVNGEDPRDREIYPKFIQSLFFLKFFQYCDACGFMAP
jgi:hypothetical protein